MSEALDSLRWIQRTEFRIISTSRFLHDLGRPTIQQRTDQRSSNRFILKMSATLEATRPAGQKKTFGKSTREVPHHTQKAKKWYPAEDELQAKKVRSIMLLRS
jgi:hypothetical protein